MQNTWVLDVLIDLKTFAAQNDMARLAEQLDDTIMVAASDMRRAGGAGRGQAPAPVQEAYRSA